MQPDQPIDDALASAVDRHLAKLKKRLGRAKKGDPDGVHDGRTALRRVREDLAVAGETVFDRERARALDDRLHDLEKALAKPRDADVMLGLVRAYLAEQPADRRDLGELCSRLEKRRKKGVRSARRRLDHHARDAVRAARDLVHGKASVAASSSTKAVPHVVHEITRETIWRAYDAVLAYETCDRADVDVLHHFRAQCRRLRYALELFGDALPRARDVVDDLHELQDRVGELHDHHVAASAIAKWVRKGKLRPTAGLERFVRAQVRARDTIRGDAMRRFERLVGPGFRVDLARALEEDRAAA